MSLKKVFCFPYFSALSDSASLLLPSSSSLIFYSFFSQSFAGFDQSLLEFYKNAEHFGLLDIRTCFGICSLCFLHVSFLGCLRQVLLDGEACPEDPIKTHSSLIIPQLLSCCSLSSPSTRQCVRISFRVSSLLFSSFL